MNQRFIVFIPWLFLCLASISAFCVPFSHWAVNAELIGKHNMGAALLFSFLAPVAIYVSLGLSVISIATAGLYKYNNIKGSKILLFATLTGLLPIVYLMWLDQ